MTSVTSGEPTTVEIRRNAGLVALVGAASSGLAIAYLARVVSGGAPLDWLLCGVLALIGGAHLVALVDGRTPLLLADETGVRMRLGAQWRGLPWEAISEVVVQQGRGPWRDGRVVVAPRSAERALAGLQPRARRSAALNRRLYGAPLAVPLGLTTTANAKAPALQERLRDLAATRSVVVVPAPDAPAPVPDGIEAEPRVQRAEGRRFTGGLATMVSRAAHGRGHDIDAEPAQAGYALAAPLAPPVPLRETRHAVRAQVERAVPASTVGATALEPVVRDLDLPERDELRRSTVELVFDPPPAPLLVHTVDAGLSEEPVIGPVIERARTYLGLSVDELAERTRIRPHIIEAIAVDDFAPCGGDFYARGHLTTLSRALGLDAGPLVASFDSRYAGAPIDARRVFEAELATGMTGSMRSTLGGSRWGLVVGVVLTLVLVWGLVRIFATQPTELIRPAPIVLDGSAGVSHTYPDLHPGAPARVSVVLRVARDTRVAVRNGTGHLVFHASVTAGTAKTLRVAPPVTVKATDAGAVRVSVDGQRKGPVGPDSLTALRTFHRPAHPATP